MSIPSWAKGFPGAITVCDAEGKIVELNEESARVFAADGGYGLVGADVYACHPQRSADILRGMMEEQRLNVYTIQKNGKKKLIYQAPWYQEDGSFGGFVELSLPIPDSMPHFNRDQS